MNQNPVERFNPSPLEGLSAEQIKQRKAEGKANIPTKKVEKSSFRILIDNTFTPFNIALFSIGAIFLFFMIYFTVIGRKDVVEKDFGISKFGFLIPAVANSIIGSVQEIHSKRVLSKLSLLSQSQATLIREKETIKANSEEIVLDDIMKLAAGDQCLADCILIEGEVSVDEGVLTGESEPIIKRKGDLIYSSSSILTGSCLCKVEGVGDDAYASKLSDKVTSLPRHKSVLMTNINRIIVFLSYAIVVVAVIVVASLCIKITLYGNDESVFGQILSLSDPAAWGKIVLTTGAFAIGMIPEGLVLLSSVALAVSIINLSKKKTLIQQLYSLENLSRVDTICLDKTGTLTDGEMVVSSSRLLIDEEEAKGYLQDLLGSFEESNATSNALIKEFGKREAKIKEKHPFSSATKQSSIIYEDGTSICLGAPEYLFKEQDEFVLSKAKEGKRVVSLSKDGKRIADFVLEDHIRENAKEAISYFYENGVDVKIISGDSPLTVSKIASYCGVKNADKYISLEGVKIEEIPQIVNEYVIFARVSPEQKLAIIEALQNNGKKVAMTGDGVNDILALRKANASITFAKATSAAKACSDVVLLDNDFVHLKDVVGQGRRVVNNVERSAILFLMKTIAIIGLAIFLIPFKKGQMWYSVENVYLLQGCVIGIGGLLLSLESHKDPIKGTFERNVFPKAFAAGILVLLGALVPIMCNRIPLLYGGQSVISDANAKSLISILTTLAGFIAAITMCTPFTKYRWICFSLMVLAGLLMAFGLPTSYIGGQTTSFSMFVSPDGNFFHAPVFHVAFQPWNSEVLIELASSWQCFLIIGLFVLIGLPFEIWARKLSNKISEKAEERIKELNSKK